MLRNISSFRAVLTALTLLGLRAPSPEHVNHLSIRQHPAGPANMLPEVLGRYGDLSNYTTFLKKYPDILARTGGYHGLTVSYYPYMGTILLAPTNAAFDKEPDFDFDNETKIVPLLQYHILQEQVLTNDLQVMVSRFPPTLLFNQTWTNITGGQRVTLIRQDEDEIVFVSGIDSRSVLQYHDRDIHFFGGVIQPIDTLLVPPLQLAATTRTWFPSMSAFLGALYKVGLADELMETQNVTIFAPDNQAFQKTFGALSELSMAELRNVLAYHIVPNMVLYSSDLQDEDQFPTRATTDDKAESVNITITIAGNNRYIDSSQIQDPDVMIANGVVHIISDLLNPLKAKAKADPARRIQSPVFELKGSTTTGTKIPTPYLSDLPCTTECPVTETWTTAPHTRRPTMRAAAAKCTAVPGALGVVGFGMLAGVL